MEEGCKVDWLAGKIQALPELEKEKLGAAEIKFELARTIGRMMHLQRILLEWALVGEREFEESRFSAKEGPPC